MSNKATWGLNSKWNKDVTARDIHVGRWMSEPLLIPRNISISTLSSCNWHQTLQCAQLWRKTFYKLQETHELKELDKRRRLEFVVKFNNPSMKNTLMSVISFFQTKPEPNKQNRRDWNFRKPSASCSIPLHNLKITFWCVFDSSKLLGPFFYENEMGIG